MPNTQTLDDTVLVDENFKPDVHENDSILDSMVKIKKDPLFEKLLATKTFFWASTNKTKAV